MAIVSGQYYDNDYFETTSSNFIIHSKSLEAKVLVLKNANANHNNSYNGKAILYYEDKDNIEYYFYFFTNKQSKRTINYGSLSTLCRLIIFM